MGRRLTTDEISRLRELELNASAPPTQREVDEALGAAGPDAKVTLVMSQADLAFHVQARRDVGALIAEVQARRLGLTPDVVPGRDHRDRSGPPLRSDWSARQRRARSA